MRHIRFKSVRSRRGFSLIEVAIAVAIAATTIVTIISLMPSGMEQMRQSANQMATARILSWVAQDLQTRNFDEWANSSQAFQYQFDASGDPVNKDQTGTLNCIYTVKVQPQAGGSSSGVGLPGAETPNSYLRRATVSITDKPGADPLNSSANSNQANVWTRTVTIVRMEKSTSGATAQASL